MTGIPIHGLGEEAAINLRAILHKGQEAIPSYASTIPLDLESTRLTENQGKYMVIIPRQCRKSINDFLENELQKDHYKSKAYPEGPTIPTPYRKPAKSTSDDISEISDDAFGGLSTIQNIEAAPSVAPSRMSHADQRRVVIENMGSWTGQRQKVDLNDLPEMIATSTNKKYGSYANAVQGKEDSSQSSQISQLTEENSQLKSEVESLQSRLSETETKLSKQKEDLQADFDKKLKAKDDELSTVHNKLSTIQEEQTEAHKLLAEMKQSFASMTHQMQAINEDNQNLHKQLNTMAENVSLLKSREANLYTQCNEKDKLLEKKEKEIAALKSKSPTVRKKAKSDSPNVKPTALFSAPVSTNENDLSQQPPNIVTPRDDDGPEYRQNEYDSSDMECDENQSIHMSFDDDDMVTNLVDRSSAEITNQVASWGLQSSEITNSSQPAA